MTRTCSRARRIVTDSGGVDTITSTITRSLAAYTAIENLTLTGAWRSMGLATLLITSSLAMTKPTCSMAGWALTQFWWFGDDTYVLAGGRT